MHSPLQMKLRPPSLPTGVVERAELLAELDGGDPVGVTMVCAPPGYGKTVLLTDWATRPSGVETAWVTIGEEDNDPRRLWASVSAALAPHTPSAVPRSSPERSAAEHAGLVAEVMEGLHASSGPIRLILDNLQELTDPESLRGLQLLVRHLPRHVHLVLASTFDPPVGLNRLRLSAQLRELRADRLSFSLAESAILLAGAAGGLTAAQVEVLHQRTGGWVAGLRLAALAIADQPDPDRFVAEFSGDERFVADYLTGEVLNRLDPDVLAFLRAISIADPVPAELAAQLSGREDAGVVLDVLEHDASLLTSVDRQRDSYRLQPLLRTYLLADLRRHGRRRLHELHVTAARWWDAGHEAVRALEHARLGEDTALTSELVRRNAVRLMANGDREPLRCALAALGDDAVVDDPYLALVSAITNLDVGDVGAARSDLRHACDAWPEQCAPELVVLRGLVELFGAASPGQTTEMPAALATDAGAPELEALIHLGLGAAHLRNGDPRTALAEFATALDLARHCGFDYLAMRAQACSGLAALRVGDLVTARAASTAATAAAVERGWQDTVWSAVACAVLGFVELQRAEPTAAGRLAAASVHAHATQGSPPLRFALQVVQGAATYDGGGRLGGLASMQRARSELGDRHADPGLLAAAALFESRAALQLGHLAAARAVRDWHADRVGDCAELELMRAWIAATEGHDKPARAALRSVLEGASPALLAHTSVEAWLLEAGLCLRAGDRTVGRQALVTALSLAEPIDSVRPFVVADPGIRQLLVAQQGGFGSSNAFAARAVAAAAASATTTAKALSEREVTVLTMLPSLLSLDDIANDLTVSVNTVKTHVRSIYTKLGVSSRRAAVLAAHENGLLTSARS